MLLERNFNTRHEPTEHAVAINKHYYYHRYLLSGCFTLIKCKSQQQYRSTCVNAEWKRVRWLVRVWKMWKPAFLSSISVRIMNARVSSVDHVHTWCGRSWMSISGVWISSTICRMLLISPEVTRSYNAGHSENSTSILTKSSVRCGAKITHNLRAIAIHFYNIIWISTGVLASEGWWWELWQPSPRKPGAISGHESWKTPGELGVR